MTKERLQNTTRQIKQFVEFEREIVKRKSEMYLRRVDLV
jgi:hypothetical protein